MLLLASAFETLFNNYPIVDILLIVFLFALAVKEVLTLIDWFKNRQKSSIKKEDKETKDNEEIAAVQKQQSEEINDLRRCVHILIDSDKNDIKAWIAEKYRKLMLQGWVDDYDLDCIERRFANYLQEGGNSYVEDLINDIRKLPKVSPIREEEKNNKEDKK
jgi:hypothetical protein